MRVHIFILQRETRLRTEIVGEGGCHQNTVHIGPVIPAVGILPGGDEAILEFFVR